MEVSELSKRVCETKEVSVQGCWDPRPDHVFPGNYNLKYIGILEDCLKNYVFLRSLEVVEL